MERDYRSQLEERDRRISQLMEQLEREKRLREETEDYNMRLETRLNVLTESCDEKHQKNVRFERELSSLRSKAVDDAVTISSLRRQLAEREISESEMSNERFNFQRTISSLESQVETEQSNSKRHLEKAERERRRSSDLKRQVEELRLDCDHERNRYLTARRELEQLHDSRNNNSLMRLNSSLRDGELDKFVQFKNETEQLLGVFEGRRDPRSWGEEEMVLVYRHFLCVEFLNNMKKECSSLESSREAKIPKICQECLLCEAHALPYRPLESTDKNGVVTSPVVPLTPKEWEKLVSIYSKFYPNGELPTAIQISADGEDYSKKCYLCQFQHIKAMR